MTMHSDVRRALGYGLDTAAALLPHRSTRGVIVLGMHRSGTSAAAGLLNDIGIKLGRDDDLMPGDEANEKGYWESAKLADFQELLLVELGGSWDAPPILKPGWERDLRLLRLAGRGRRLFHRLYGDLQQWGWKDPRTCLLLPFWRRSLSLSPIVVVVHRNPLEVAASLAARDGFTTERSLALWERYNRSLLANAVGSPVLVLSYDDLTQKAGHVTKALKGFLQANGLVTVESPPAPIGFIDPQLRHSFFDSNDLAEEPLVSEGQRRLAQHAREFRRSARIVQGGLGCVVKPAGLGEPAGVRDTVPQFRPRSVGVAR